MKKMLWKIAALCLALALLTGACSALAEASLVMSELHVGTPVNAYIELGSDTDYYKASQITSSNPDVVEAALDEMGIGITLTPLKVGQSEITVTYKLNGTGEDLTVSATCVVKNQPSPFSWVKVNGKKISLAKNPSGYTLNGYKKKNGKIQFKLKKGWKVVKLHAETWGNEPDSFKELKWKNGKIIKIATNRSCYATIEVKKGSETFTYGIGLIRPE